MNTLEIVYAYDKLLDRLAKDLKDSKYKLQFFLDILKMKRGLFYKKMKLKRFTSQEMILLSQHLYKEEYEQYQEGIILKKLEESKEQIMKGQTVNFEEAITEARKSYAV